MFALLLAAVGLAQEGGHDRFRARLSNGMRGPVEQRDRSPSSPPTESLDMMYWMPPPNPPPRKASPPPPQHDVCADDYSNFRCADGVPCIMQCTGCPDAGCWLRCYDKCDKAKHQEWVGDHCSRQCVEQHARCQRDCEAEAARIAAAARPSHSAANASSSSSSSSRNSNISSRADSTADRHLDRHCGIGEESEGTYPFDCKAPCLEQCDPCASSSQCLPRCFHQCTQGSHCQKASVCL